ncbi:hypothetical protein BG004_000109 [Podila humilis]|nr:hypothetical protein BG004_000109 [Podila humilis]
MGSDDPKKFETLLGALKSLHAGHGHSNDNKKKGGKIGPKHGRKNDYDFDPFEHKPFYHDDYDSDDNEDSEEDEDNDDDDDDSEDEDDEHDDFDFEADYKDNSVMKLDFRNVSSKAQDKRKTRKVDDLLRQALDEEEEDINLLPLWRSGIIGNGDGSNRQIRSSRAKGYDLYEEDDSDEEFRRGGKMKNKNKKNKNKNKQNQLDGDFQSLLDINRSQSIGSGKRRFPILIKTDRTSMPLHPGNVNRLLAQDDNEIAKLSAQVQGGRFSKGNNSNSNNGGGYGGGKKARGGNGGGKGIMDGQVVGAAASEISVENLGHRMLSKMGWSPGVGLGASGEGITQPIEAIMRSNRRGLGHE